MSCLLQIDQLRAEPLVLDPATAPYTLAPHAEASVTQFPPFVEGMTPQMFYPSIEEMVAKAEAGAFSPVTTRNIGFGLNPVVVSARVAVQNKTDVDQSWILAFNRAAQYYYAVYFVPDGGPIPAAALFAFDVDFDVWDNSDVLIHTPFTLPAETSGYLYVAYQNLNGAVPMTIEVPADYVAKRRFQDVHFFSVVGLTLGLVVITASLMLLLRRFVAVFYALAVVSGVVMVLVSEQYIGALVPRLAEVTLSGVILTYIALGGPVFAVLFQRQYFADVGGTGKTFGRVLLFAALFCVVSVVGVIQFNAFPVILPIIALSGCVLLVVVNGIIAVRKGFVGRWPFFVGSAVYAGGIVVKVASFEMSHLLSAREASLVLLYAIALEALALAMTMFMQVRSMRHDKDRAIAAQIQAAENAVGMAKALTHAAHDIQQPLASLRLAMGAQTGTDADVQQAIDYLEEIARRQLANPYAALADPVHDKTASFAVQAVLRNIQTMFGNEAADRGLRLHIVPSTVQARGDVFVVMRIVSNLVSNAIKNTCTGGVVIGCRHHGNRLCIDVVDTGRGMDTHHIAALTQHSDIDEGEGLGIIRDLCIANDLRIEAQTTPNKGTRVRLILPRAC